MKHSETIWSWLYTVDMVCTEPPHGNIGYGLAVAPTLFGWSQATFQILEKVDIWVCSQNWGMPENIQTWQFQLGKRTCYKSPASHCSPPDRTWSWASAGLSGFEQGRDDIDATAAPDKSCRIHYGRDIDPQHLCGQNMSKLAIVEAIWSLLGMATHRNRDPIRCNSRSSCGFHRSSSSELADVTLSVVVDEKSGDMRRRDVNAVKGLHSTIENMHLPSISHQQDG